MLLTVHTIHPLIKLLQKLYQTEIIHYTKNWCLITMNIPAQEQNGKWFTPGHHRIKTNFFHVPSFSWTTYLYHLFCNNVCFVYSHLIFYILQEIKRLLLLLLLDLGFPHVYNTRFFFHFPHISLNKRVRVLKSWPPQSPHLNIIKCVCNFLNKNIKPRIPKTLDEHRCWRIFGN